MASGAPAGQLAVSGLMPPPPPRAPKRKEVVLDEDEYTSTLEAIIERDFFPELPKLESKVAWLQAIRSGDPEQIRNAQLMIAHRRAAAAGGRPHTGATPAGAPLFTPGGTAARAVAGHTPHIPALPPGEPLPSGAGTGYGADDGQATEANEEEAGPAVAPPVSLDTFLAKHTSEDNASFQEILEDTNKRRRLRAAAQLALQPDPKLLITDGRERTDGFGTSGQQPDTLVPWRYDPKNALFYDAAQRDVVPYTESELAAMVQGAPKAINHGGTRFPKELQPSASATPSGAGGSTISASSSGVPAGQQGGALPAKGGSRGYDILATPSFDPGVEETPFVTWGDIEATPMRIEAEDLPPGPLVDGPSFFIKENSRKDKAAHRLANKAGASLRRKGAGLRGGTPLVSSAVAAAAAARRPPTSGRPPTAPTAPGSQRGKPLSAAAQRLASSMHKKRLAGTDIGLRASYSGATPLTGRPASSAAGSTWSAHATPGRAWTPAATPSMHATLEEEEARVQALMRQRQLEAEQRQEREAARAAAQEAFKKQQDRVSTRQPGAAQQQQQQPRGRPPGGASGGAAAGSADLTAGLLTI